MDKFKFALLVSWIAAAAGKPLAPSDLRALDDLVQPEPLEPVPVPQVNPGAVILMLRHLANGRKIDAIKELRSMTGLGLKESKDMIEAATTGPI